MNINTMRKIDHHAGILLCFLLNRIFKLWSLVHRERRINPNNVLLIELSEMGSAVLADPAMQKLKSIFKANLYFVIFKKNQYSLSLLNTVKNENIFSIREDNFVHLTYDTIRFLFWTRRKSIDTVIDLELFSRFTALLTALSGASNRVGFYAFHNEGLYRGDFLTHKVAYNSHMHIAKNFIALVNALKSDKQELPYSKTYIDDKEIQLNRVRPSLEQKKAVYDIISSHYSDYSPKDTTIILVNSNSSDLLPQRCWDRKNFCEVIKKILAFSSDTLILLTGSPSEKEGAQELSDSVNDRRCINFAGAVKFSQLTTLYSVSYFMLTNDSGPAHFASLTDMQTFVLFGPETPTLYGSLGKSTAIFANLACSPCVSATNHRKTPCYDNVCLQVISPEMVFETLLPMLKKLNKKSGALI